MTKTNEIGFNIQNILPISLSYEDATRLYLRNHSAVRVISAGLDIHPYFIFDYTLNLARVDPTGHKHTIRNSGRYIIDAFSGKCIKNDNNHKGSNTVRGIIQSMFSKGAQNSNSINDADSNERRILIEDLTTHESVSTYSLMTEGTHSISIVDDKISSTAARRILLENVVGDNIVYASYQIKKPRGKIMERKFRIKPMNNEVRIRKERLVQVPKWIITFKAAQINYRRCMMATSGKLVIDEIASCRNRYFSSGRFDNLSYEGCKKTSHAVCEICGYTLCVDHIFEINDSFYCSDHKSTNLVTDS